MDLVWCLIVFVEIFWDFVVEVGEVWYEVVEVEEVRDWGFCIDEIWNVGCIGDCGYWVFEVW